MLCRRRGHETRISTSHQPEPALRQVLGSGMPAVMPGWRRQARAYRAMACLVPRSPGTPPSDGRAGGHTRNGGIGRPVHPARGVRHGRGRDFLPGPHQIRSREHGPARRMALLLVPRPRRCRWSMRGPADSPRGPGRVSGGPAPGCLGAGRRFQQFQYGARPAPPRRVGSLRAHASHRRGLVRVHPA